MSILTDYSSALAEGRYLAVMPISRLTVERKCSIGRFTLYPAGEVDVSELRPVPLSPMEYYANREIQGQDLREAATVATGVSTAAYNDNPLIVWDIDLNWEDFLLWDHNADLALLSTLSQDAEGVMDLVRFYFCRIDLPDTLPGPVGTWESQGPFSTALLYTTEDNESYIIAGSVISHMVVKGIGLQLDDCQLDTLEEVPFPLTNGEVGAIAAHALTLLSGVLDSNTATTKFSRALSLLEFLAYPNEYQKFQEVKKQISRHVAKSRTEYDSLLERFKQLTSLNDSVTRQQLGYRTRIVHMGQRLEDVVPLSEHWRLFLELNRYIGVVIQHMIDRHDLTWAEFLEFREELKTGLGID